MTLNVGCCSAINTWRPRAHVDTVDKFDSFAIPFVFQMIIDNPVEEMWKWNIYRHTHSRERIINVNNCSCLPRVVSSNMSLSVLEIIVGEFGKNRILYKTHA